MPRREPIRDLNRIPQSFREWKTTVTLAEEIAEGLPRNVDAARLPSPVSPAKPADLDYRDALFT